MIGKFESLNMKVERAAELNNLSLDSDTLDFVLGWLDDNSDEVLSITESELAEAVRLANIESGEYYGSATFSDVLSELGILVVADPVLSDLDKLRDSVQYVLNDEMGMDISDDNILYVAERLEIVGVKHTVDPTNDESTNAAEYTNTVHDVAVAVDYYCPDAGKD